MQRLSVNDFIQCSAQIIFVSVVAAVLIVKDISVVSQAAGSLVVKTGFDNILY